MSKDTEFNICMDKIKENSDIKLTNQQPSAFIIDTSKNGDSSSVDDKNNNVVKTKGISYFTAYVNFVKALLGVGCLALPLALKDGGLIPGLMLIIGFGFLNALCMTQLIHCAQYLSRKKGEGRLELGQVAYDSCVDSFTFFRNKGNILRFMVNCCVVGLQMGISSVYYVFVAVHAKEIVEYYTDIRWSETTYMLLIFVPFVVINLLKTLKIIAVISTVGNIIMTVCLLFIFQFLIRQNHHWVDIPYFTSFNGVMTACGAVLYAFEGQAMVIPLENKLKKPNQMRGYTGIISTGINTVTMVYAICGFLGYITYSTLVQGSIALNLPKTLIYMILRGLLVLVVFTGFPIQQYIVIVLTLPTVKEWFKNKINSKNEPNKDLSKSMNIIIEFLIRLFLVIICMIVGITIPNLEKIIPIVGISCGILLAFFFPPLFEALIFLPIITKKFEKPALSKNEIYSLKCKYYKTLIKNSVIMSFGIFCLVAGLKATLTNLFNN